MLNDNIKNILIFYQAYVNKKNYFNSIFSLHIQNRILIYLKHSFTIIHKYTKCSYIFKILKQKINKAKLYEIPY